LFLVIAAILLDDAAELSALLLFEVATRRDGDADVALDETDAPSTIMLVSVVRLERAILLYLYNISNTSVCSGPRYW